MILVSVIFVTEILYQFVFLSVPHFPISMTCPFILLAYVHLYETAINGLLIFICLSVEYRLGSD